MEIVIKDNAKRGKQSFPMNINFIVFKPEPEEEETIEFVNE